MFRRPDEAVTTRPRQSHAGVARPGGEGGLRAARDRPRPGKHPSSLIGAPSVLPRGELRQFAVRRHKLLEPVQVCSAGLQAVDGVGAGFGRNLCLRRHRPFQRCAHSDEIVALGLMCPERCGVGRSFAPVCSALVHPPAVRRRQARDITLFVPSWFHELNADEKLRLQVGGISLPSRA